MAFFLNHIARFAAQKIASDPVLREKAMQTARSVAKEAQQIASEEDRARAAGRAVRRALDKFQGGS